MKKLYLFFCILFLIILIPSLIVIIFDANSISNNKSNYRVTGKETKMTDKPLREQELDVTVSVYRTSKQTIEEIPLEEYVKGVLAAEMPVTFELEALKAQALSARTYIVKSLISSNKSNVPNGADITDSTLHQVYKSKSELKKAWGRDYNMKMKKLTQAVNETRGQILAYEGAPIDAFFFSTSNGYTENSEDYWSTSIPYLRSVPSPWDQFSPKFKDAKTFSINNFEKKLGVQVPLEGTVDFIKRNNSQRVERIKIGGKEMKGKDVREALGLNSSDFTISRKGDQIVVTTKGYGHGVGLSQYGANGMAKEGKNYKNIIDHYYKDVTISDFDSLQGMTHLMTRRN